MGLLDWTGDKDQNSAINQGLLAAAFGALAGRGNRLQAIGQGGLTGLLGYTNAINQQEDRRQQAENKKLRDLQFEQAQFQFSDAKKQAEQRAALEALPAQFMRPGSLPSTMDNRDVGQPGEAPITPTMDLNGLANAYMSTPGGFGTGLQLAQSLRKDNTPISLGKGARLITPDGREIANNPDTPELPSAVREYQFAQAQGYKGTFNDFVLNQKRAGASNISYGAPVAGVDANGNNVFFQPDKGGGAPAIVPGVAPPAKDRVLTESQAKAATFKSQMDAAEQELAGNPIDMANYVNQADVAVAGGLTNFVSSPSAQRARQAQEQWAESFLRFKTGAAATKDEVRRNVATYFPQPGDSQAVIEQKARQRQQAINDVGFAAGGGPKNIAPNVLRFDANGRPVK